MRDLMTEILKTGDDILILCKDKGHLNVLRTQLSRERRKMVRDCDSLPGASLIATKAFTKQNNLFLKLYLKDKLKTFKFSESGELQEVVK